MGVPITSFFFFFFNCDLYVLHNYSRGNENAAGEARLGLSQIQNQWLWKSTCEGWRGRLLSKSEHVFHHVFPMRKEANLSHLINPRDKAVSREAANVLKKDWAPPFFFFFFTFLHCTTGPNLHVNKEDLFLSRAAEMLRHCDLGQWAKQSPLSQEASSSTAPHRI